MNNPQHEQQLADIHQLLDLIECMNLVGAQPWWVEMLQRIRARYAGTHPAHYEAPPTAKVQTVKNPKRYS